MKPSHILSLILLLLQNTYNAQAQSYFDVSQDDGAYQHTHAHLYPNATQDSTEKHWGRKERKPKKPLPKGVSQWVIDPLMGDSLAAENNDTLIHNFQWWNLTDGPLSDYSYLGNIGSPRLSRRYFRRPEREQLIFIQALDYFLDNQKNIRFSNTKSPLTNLAYHKTGNRTNGQERFRAYFATNISTHSGLGFHIDYLYGRGYYNAQNNSMFASSFFAYHLGKHYQMHALIHANHNKMAENGGIENETYITDPQSLPQRYSSKDIPTNLSQTWNRNDGETYHLSQRYRLGKEKEIILSDSLKPKMPSPEELIKPLSDSLKQVILSDSLKQEQVLDSLRKKWQAKQVIPTTFVPIAALGHTLELRTLRHRFYSYDTPENYYTQLYWGSLQYIRNRTDALIMDNTISLSILEGFNKWAAMGLSLYMTHHLEAYTQPYRSTDSVQTKRDKLHKIYLGARLSRSQGTLFHYNAQAQLVGAGKHMGEFDAKANIQLNLPLGRRDTIALETKAYIMNQQPAYYLEHYHNQVLWWDNTLEKTFKTRIQAQLSNKRTHTTLSMGIENIKNYTYLSMQNTPLPTSTNPKEATQPAYSHNTIVQQYNKNIQILSLTLEQALHLGPVHWDNILSYQTTSQSDILPLPVLNLYSNLYLKFRIAKTLNVQLGADLRYFSAYYAPTYSPAANQFALQDSAHPRTKIGNYPILSAYANLHLQHCRLYIAAHHLNAGTGRAFWAPNYPIDPMTIRLGVSWNFFN